MTPPTPDLRAARRRRRREKVASLIANELIVDGLAHFLATRFPTGAGSVLDLGAGSKPYAPLYEPYFAESVTLDVGNELYGDEVADVIAQGDAMPFPDARFDCVICTEVLEHCPDPAGVLAEVHRVLKPGGVAYVTTPFMVGLHDMPYDFFRYTPSALRMLGEQAGLEVESLRPRGDWLGVALTIWIYPIVKALSRMPAGLFRYENPLVWLLVAAPQLAYLRYWRAVSAGGGGPIARALEKTPLGYITVMSRPATGQSWPDTGAARR